MSELIDVSFVGKVIVIAHQDLSRAWMHISAHSLPVDACPLPANTVRKTGFLTA